MLGVTTGAVAGRQESQFLLSNTGFTDGNGHAFVKTVAGGTFSISLSEYNCGAGGVSQLVYLYSSGGNPGLANGTNNSGAGLMAVLGTCTNKVFSPTLGQVQMNEVTTIAAAYALAGYASDPTHISGNQTGTTTGIAGLNNAVSMAATLASLGTGQALAPGINGTAVQEEINTLANTLAACINTAGPSSAGCLQVLPFAGNAADTAAAAINIAHNPGASVSQLYMASTGFKQFLPVLGAQPQDWTIGITYTDTSLNGVSFVAIDASGDAWVTNNDNNSITEFGPGGNVLHTTKAGGLNGPNGIAIDAATPTAHVWVANGGQGNGTSISEFTTGAVAVTSSPFSGGGLNNPWGVALDPSGNVWVANMTGNSLTEFIPGNPGAFANANGFPDASLDDPLAIASDAGGNLWVANTGGGTGTSIDEFVPGTGAGTGFFNFPDSSGLMDPVGIAVDGGGNVWAANEFANGSTEFVTMLNPSHQFTSFSGGGISRSDGIAIDGSSNVWLANFDGNTVSEFNSNGSITGTNGYQFQTGNLDHPQGIAIDNSGNVWVANNGANTITEIVGAATPVVTPIAAAVKSSLGTPP